MSYQLSEGALATIMGGGQVENPIMQILGNKRISGAGDSERYRLLVSDGVHVNSFAMLATQLNEMIRRGDLADNTIVKIKRFITSMVPNSGRGEKRVMIILDVEVEAPGNTVGSRIGSPQPLNADGQVPNQPAATPAAAAPTPAPFQNRSPPKASPAPSAAPSRSAGFGGGYGANIRSPARGGNDLTPSSNTHPIASLTPYQNKWVIKARVTGKTPIRTWSNSKGEGKLFSFDLVDESGEIRATAFREQCDKFFDTIEVNKVFLISKCQLKTANKKFSNLNNDYEMSLTSETQIISALDDDSDVPQIKFNFISLDRIEGLEAAASVDVIGVVKSCGDVNSFVARSTNKEMRKREVTLVDQSKTAVSLTLWGQQADDFDGSNQPVVAVKGGRINEFGGGKSVSVSGNSTLQINPDIPEAHQLRGWFDHEGANAEVKNISARTAGGGGGGMDGNLITLREAKDTGLGKGDKPDFFNCKGTVLLCKSENALYKACPGDNCNKKVVDMNNGLYRCEKCNRDYPNFNPRLILSMSVGDWSDHSWVTIFQEGAEVLLGKTSQEMLEYQESSPDLYQQAFQQAAFKSFNFRLRAQVQTYNDEQRMRMSVASLKPIDHKVYAKSLLQQLKEIGGMGTVTH